MKELILAGFFGAYATLAAVHGTRRNWSWTLISVLGCVIVALWLGA